MRVLIISGRSGAGKSTLASVLSPALRIPVLNVGNLVWRSVLNAGFQPTTRYAAGERFLEIFGERHLGELVASAAVRRPLIVEGVRVPLILEVLRSRCLSLTHIHLEAPDWVRAERLWARDGAVSTEEAFLDADNYFRRTASFLLSDFRCDVRQSGAGLLTRWRS